MNQKNFAIVSISVKEEDIYIKYSFLCHWVWLLELNETVWDQIYNLGYFQLSTK